MFMKPLSVSLISIGSAFFLSAFVSTASAETKFNKIDELSVTLDISNAGDVDFDQLVQADETVAEKAKREREERKAERERKRAERAAKRKQRSSRPRFGSFN